MSVGAFDQFDAADSFEAEKFHKFPALTPGIPISTLFNPYGNLAFVALEDLGMGDSGGRPHGP
jgi:hypothetical protein